MMMMVVVAAHRLLQGAHGSLGAGQITRLQRSRQRAECARSRGARTTLQLAFYLRGGLKQRGEILLGGGDVAGLQIARQGGQIFFRRLDVGGRIRRIGSEIRGNATNGHARGSGKV